MSKCTKKNCPMNAKTLNPDCNLKGCPYRTGSFDKLHFVADNAGLSIFEAIEKAYNMGVSEQESITWIVGKDNAQVAVRNMPIDMMQKICAIIGEEKQQPCDDCISRKSVLDIAKKGVLISNGSYESVCKAINELPPVIPSIKEWLSSFNTNSATECFTAVQELREKIKTN